MKIKSILFVLFILVAFSCSSKVVPLQTLPQTSPNVTAIGVQNKVVLNENQCQGKILFETNCANCHDLYAPSDYSKEQWRPILKRMQANTNLKDAEIEQIHDYLTNGM